MAVSWEGASEGVGSSCMDGGRRLLADEPGAGRSRRRGMTGGSGGKPVRSPARCPLGVSPPLSLFLSLPVELLLEPPLPLLLGRLPSSLSGTNGANRGSRGSFSPCAYICSGGGHTGGDGERDDRPLEDFSDADPMEPLDGRRCPSVERDRSMVDGRGPGGGDGMDGGEGTASGAGDGTPDGPDGCCCWVGVVPVTLSSTVGFLSTPPPASPVLIGEAERLSDGADGADGTDSIEAAGRVCVAVGGCVRVVAPGCV
mmetsp:Transcript_35301/g.87688  ORF Transcript_35301/g.87688 Transcript_35301/m.87688 type:complete len:256 (-) Transcript_35301:1997-2764(-)